MNNSKRYTIYLPIAFSLVLVAGVYLGTVLNRNDSENVMLQLNTSGGSGKVDNIIGFIEENYVDTVNSVELETTAIKEMMKDGFNDYQVREAMKKNGMKTISDKLKEMLLAGETSYEEAIRVGLMDG